MNEENEKLFGDKKIPFKVMIKRIGHYVIPEWKAFTLAFLLILINVGTDISLPHLIGKFTDYIADINVPLSYILNILKICRRISLIPCQWAP